MGEERVEGTPSAEAKRRPTGLTIIAILWFFGGIYNLYTSSQVISDDLEALPLLSDPWMHEWFKFGVPIELAINLLVFALGIIQMFTIIGLWTGKSWSYKLALAIPVLAVVSWISIAGLYMSAPIELGIRESINWVPIGASIFWMIIYWSYLRKPHVKEYLGAKGIGKVKVGVIVSAVLVGILTISAAIYVYPRLAPPSPPPGWTETLDWMQNNLTLWEQEHHKTAVVASWWDYGYWITTIGNKTSLADNDTWNKTRISKMFMSNETEALKILNTYDATHIVVYTVFDQNGNDVGWGDEGKWRERAHIGGLNETDYGSTTEQGQWQWNWKGQETVIYKLMQYGKEVTLRGYSTILLEHFEEAYLSQTTGSPRTYGGAIPLVCVYKIK